MGELRIPLDPCNPGQFYACCGLIELLELSGNRTASRFSVDQRRPHQAYFVVTSEKELDVQSIVGALREAEYRPLRRQNAENPPTKDSIAPASVSIFGQRFMLDWWLDEFHYKATPLKCWAGQVTTQKLLTELPRLLEAGEIGFNTSVFSSTRFGIDPRSAWVALDLGYSPNEQGQESQTYPFVEMLAAFGLQGFRPAGDRTTGFQYSLWLSPLPCAVARIASARPWLGLRAARYKFSLGERGSYKFFCFSKPIFLRSDT